MKQLEYTVRFTTPAFLGNAEQSAQWRTPPFKALLRQWWRVAYAADKQFNVDVAEMRREEGLLFGNAWLSHREGDREVNDHCKSLVRIRLDRWDEGKLKSWDGLEQPKVHHPETEKTQYKVGPHAYLGYGPLDGRGNTTLRPKKVAIQAGENAQLRLALTPDPRDPNLVARENPRIATALALMNRYGTLGGRSRNGWGSFALEPIGDTPALPPQTDAALLRPWRDALALDWPHAIGRDAKGPLIWHTAPHDDWKALMKTLADIKIRLRTQPKFKFPNDKPDGEVHDRHWLSYPVTKHNVRAWDRDKLRLPNSLRFKLRPDAQDPKKLRGVIFHVPCLPPPSFKPNRTAIESVWQQVHTFLDAPAQNLARAPC
jgi:CRISPR-associated protein Cmr1